MKQILITTILFFSISVIIAQTELHFNNLDSLLNFAENNSYTVKNAEYKTLISKWQKISAKAGLLNFRMQTSFNMTDNLKLPVTYMPAEAFGGAPGDFKEVTTGQEYISNLNILPQIDLINLSNWAKLKSAKVDTKLTEVTNLLAKKTLFESISASYFNITSLKAQIKTTTETLIIADTLLLQIQQKYDKGLVRLQDLNDAKVNKLTTNDKLDQLKNSLELQLYNIKVLCDIPLEDNIYIDEKQNSEKLYLKDLSTNNILKYKQSVLQADKLKAEVDKNKFMQLPVLSFYFYDAWQQNSNNYFFDNNASWINSQNVGLKLSIPFPNVNAYTQTKIAKINAENSIENAEHIKLQNELENKQMILDYKKAYQQLETNEQIKILKEENYKLAINQFNEDILSTDRLLIIFNDMLISQLNYNISFANLEYAISKININNNIK